MFFQKEDIKITDSCPVMELAALMTIGNRECQQDCFDYHLNSSNGLVILCDGMGGHEDGAAASAAVAVHFTDSYRNKSPEEDDIAFLDRIIHESNDIVKSISKRNGYTLGSGTTAVSVIINKNKLFWCAAGDSRAYLYRNGEFAQFTLDQNYKTVLYEKKRAGLIDESEFRKEMLKGDTLISYVGIDDLKLVDYNDNPLFLKDEDRIVIMSDGLYRLLSDTEIAESLKKHSDISEALTDMENKAKNHADAEMLSRDNTTIIIIKIHITEE